LSRLALSLAAILSATIVLLGQGVSAEAMQGPGAYTVAPGDTLFAISRNTGASVDDLVAMNNITDPDVILAGQTLQLGGAAPSTVSGYVVQPGDTLSGIALSKGVSRSNLAAINGLSNLDLIVAGTMLDLPSSGSRASLAINQGPGPVGIGMKWKASPNFWAGRPYGPPIALVLHTADGSMVGIDGEFASPRSGLSTHFAVGLDGSIHQYVELADRAWGNGYTEAGNVWPGPAGVSPNHLTVSIETEDQGSPYQSVTDAQYKAMVDVGRLILRTYPGVRYLVSHRAIAPETRHDDPGPRWIASGRFVALANALGLQPIP
jgi:LysM repeat protein